MYFENIVLIHKKDGVFSKEGMSIKIECCFENINSFYEENDIIFLELILRKDFSDEMFYKIVDEFCYSDFENLGVNIYPKDDEYYPVFVIELKNDSVGIIQEKIDVILNLFMEKVTKIYL